MNAGSKDNKSSLDQDRTLKDISVNTAGVLCYLGVWVSGIIFLILEQKNRYIRFHSLQSIITFGILFVAGSIVNHLPAIGDWLSGLISFLGFILWIVLMVKAGQGEWFKLIWVGDLAETIANSSMPRTPPDSQSASSATFTRTDGPPTSPPGSAGTVDNQSTSLNAVENPVDAPVQPSNARPPEGPSIAVPPPVIETRSGTTPAFSGETPLIPPHQSSTGQPAGSPSRAESSFSQQSSLGAPVIVEPPPSERSRQAENRHDRSWRSDEFKSRYYSQSAHNGRVVGSAFAIAWSIILIIFFNYFSKYIAYYHPLKLDGNPIWEVYPLVTDAFATWLPIVTLALVVSIIGHALILVYDRYVARQGIQLVIDVFSMAAIIALVSIFPFDFSPIPNDAVVYGLEIGLPITLIILAVAIGISVLVRVITLIIHLAENRY